MLALFVIGLPFALTLGINNPNMSMKTLTFLVFSLVLSSCNIIDFNDKGFIDPEIKPYVDSFVKEAEARGLYFDVSDLKISFKDLRQGQQGTTYPTTKKIFIDNNSAGWKLEPEVLVFHELGHLYLKLGHDNRMMGLGYYQSIMANAGDPQYNSDEHYYRRQYYVDQLFDRQTAIPKWAYDF